MKQHLYSTLFIFSLVCLISSCDKELSGSESTVDKTITLKNDTLIMSRMSLGSTSGWKNIGDTILWDIFALDRNFYPDDFTSFSITFKGNKDSLVTNLKYNNIISGLQYTYNPITYQYKFENNALKIWIEDTNTWISIGYGNKDKITLIAEYITISDQDFMIPGTVFHNGSTVILGNIQKEEVKNLDWDAVFSRVNQISKTLYSKGKLSDSHFLWYLKFYTLQ